MKADDVVLLLRKLGCHGIRPPNDKGWVNASCPFAQWTHAGGIDGHPSFGVHSADGASHYRCQGCSKRGNLVTMPFALQALGAPQLLVREIESFIRTRNVQSLGAIQERVRKAAYAPAVAVPRRPQISLDNLDGEIPEMPDLPESDLRAFEKLPADALARPVLSKRLITPQTYERWQVRWLEWKGRIAVPVRDYKKRLVGITGRLADEENCWVCKVPYVTELITLEPTPAQRARGEEARTKKRVYCPECEYDRPPKYLHTKGFSRDYYLFGEHMAVPGRRVILVEGHFDVLGLWQAGYNALGVMGTFLSVYQIQKIVRWFPEAVILPDRDKAGVGLGESAKRDLTGRIPCSVQLLPDDRDPDQLPDSTLLDILGPPDRIAA
jgi:hypothetical protein